jgi:non-specific serine/threonine protein kinase
MANKMVPQDSPQEPHEKVAVDHPRTITNLTLPAQLTSFIGRKHEMAEVKQLLVSSRLVTLTGAGGCGKTRLALRVASDLQGTFADGVCWVDLASLSNPTLLPQAVAQVLNIGESSERAFLDLILDRLNNSYLLLVLDNCEHLALACADFAHDVLCDAPYIRILATSREPLAVIGEMLYPVPPLALPPKSQAADMMLYDSVRLFVERTQGVLPGFTFTSANALPVADICRRLDGIPLAIELASARMNVLTVEQIATRLDDRFALLTSAQHGVPSHHRTLRAALDWSYSTLSGQEQTLLRRLSVLAGSCTLEAIEEVCAGEGIASGQIVDSLWSLANKSLVVAETLKQGAARYRLLETVRQYALEKLLESNEGEAFRNRHLDYYLKFAEEVEPELHGPDQNLWLNYLDRDHDNLRTALEWSLGEGRIEKGLRLAAALMWFWEMRTYWTEARQRVKSLLSQPEAAPRTLVRAKALLVVATMGGWGGINSQERPYAEELIGIAREHGVAGNWVLAAGLAQLSHMLFREDLPGAISLINEGLDIKISPRDDWLIAYMLMLQGWYFNSAKNYPAALKALEDSLRRFKSLGDQHWSTIVSGVISIIHYYEGNLGRARQEFEQVLPVFREMRDRRAVVNLLMYLGDIELESGNYNRAKKYYEEYLKVAREIGDRMHIANGTYYLGSVLLHENDLNSARLLFAETLERGREIGMNYVEWAIFGFACMAAAEKKARRAIRLFAFSDRLFHGGNAEKTDEIAYRRYLALAQDQVDKEGFDAAWAEGCSMPVEQAIAEAEQESLVPSTVQTHALPRDPNVLTPRETEVLRLVAAGLSDAQVAAQLVISRRTVSTHLTAIYGKLGVSSRSAATRYALDHDLI